MNRCIQESKLAMESAAEELQQKISRAAVAEVQQVVTASIVEQFQDVQSKCENLLTSAAESVSLQQLQHAQQLTSTNTKEMLDELHSRWEHQRENSEALLLQQVDKRLEKVGIEIESRSEKRVDKKISASVSKLENETGVYRFFVLCSWAEVDLTCRVKN